MKTPPVFSYMRNQFTVEKFFIWTKDMPAMLDALKEKGFRGTIAGMGACITVPAYRHLFPTLAATVLGTDHGATMETETEVIDLSPTGQNYGMIYTRWVEMHPEDLIPISADNRLNGVLVTARAGGRGRPFTTKNWKNELRYFLVPTEEYPYPALIGFVINPAQHKEQTKF